MFSQCWCKHRRCIFDVIISRMICVIHRRFYRTALQNIDNVMAMFSPVCFIFHLHPVIRQQNKSVLSFIHDLIRQPQGMWLHVKSLHLFDITPPTHLGDHRPTIVDSKSTSLNVSLCSADYSSNHPWCIDENSAKCRWYFPEGSSHRVCVFSCDHTFDFGTDRHQST